MKFMQHWRKSWRRPESPTAAEIRQRLTALRHQRDQVTAKQDAIALDAMRSDAVADQYQHFGAELAGLAGQIQVLEAALPHAEREEAEAARQAEAAALAQRIEHFHARVYEARRFLDPILDQLVTGEELTQARDVSLLLSREADALHRLTGDARFRRPLDPFAQIRDALGHRIERIDRARWAKSSPITLLDDTKAAS